MKSKSAREQFDPDNETRYTPESRNLGQYSCNLCMKPIEEYDNFIMQSFHYHKECYDTVVASFDLMSPS